LSHQNAEKPASHFLGAAGFFAAKHLAIRKPQIEVPPKAGEGGGFQLREDLASAASRFEDCAALSLAGLLASYLSAV
jgi:hypothetical protein